MRYIRVGNALHKSAVLSGVLALGMSLISYCHDLCISRLNVLKLLRLLKTCDHRGGDSTVRLHRSHE